MRMRTIYCCKYGDELVNHQMKQFLRLGDIDMDRSSKKGMSIKDQEALKRMELSLCSRWTL